uniref:Matrix-remodeling-associated protein 7 helical domain-containing protein n=1 Tax=Tabanus bromius TaxID=304241 RepID=A0A0K8TPV0_TABBR
MENFKLFVSNISDTYIYALFTICLSVTLMLIVEKWHNIKLKISEPKIDKSEDEDTEECTLARQMRGGLVSQLKSAKLKKIEASLTEEQIEEERKIEKQQLEAIFELLKTQEAELKTSKIDYEEFNQQLNLYR